MLRKIKIPYKRFKPKPAYLPDKKACPSIVSIGFGKIHMLNLVNREEKKFVINLFKKLIILDRKKLTLQQKDAILEFAVNLKNVVIRMAATPTERNTEITLNFPEGGKTITMHFKMRLGSNGRIYILPAK